MPFSVTTSIEIDAPPERVWEVLTDFAGYQEWNPFIFSASGSATPGETLLMRFRDLKGRVTTFSPTVVAAVPGRELRWLGKLVHARLFAGEHQFYLRPLDGDRTRLEHREDFTGLLMPLLRPRMRRWTAPQFPVMDKALARVAESAPGA
ncbi:SRPBCC domain-containing protein [Allostreptomyces psammosilenae]|uniref:SRPBCC domain-containing protein n=1 Tax=Allostreptomyces psammosilenae TaxID=1892865 RepID=A0A852ZQ36_9ACTN|nr:SRPBCC domain-containing protein [Allostreptomyces psammosilenae]NYI03607.1 hypothetical protein [Allostreptomyces psammosilenae]